jgi:hypothetical protein
MRNCQSGLHVEIESKYPTCNTMLQNVAARYARHASKWNAKMNFTPALREQPQRNEDTGRNGISLREKGE